MLVVHFFSWQTDSKEQLSNLYWFKAIWIFTQLRLAFSLNFQPVSLVSIFLIIP